MLSFLIFFLAPSHSESIVIDTIGFHQITNVTAGDNITVNYYSRSLRLFLFIPFNSCLIVGRLFIDGKNVSSEFHNKPEDEIGFAVDAENSVEFTFDLKDNTKSLFESNYISLWFIPQDLCSTSSYFESGGLSTYISSNPSNQSIISKSDYIQYSMCAFSPVFDYTEVSYSINFGVDPKGYKDIKSKSCLYTNYFNTSELCINDYDSDARFKVSDAFFIQYTINALAKDSNYITNVDDRIKIILRRDTDKSNNTDFFDLFCVAQALESCNSTTCIYDRDIENSFDYKCNTKLEHYFLILLITLCSVVAFIILIVILCSCGCCICCGVAGCTFCCCNINHNKKMNQRLLDEDPETMKTFSQSNNNDYYTQNPAVPLVYPMEQQQYIQQYQNPTIQGNPPIIIS